jgi:hypothetical protein
MNAESDLFYYAVLGIPVMLLIVAALLCWLIDIFGASRKELTRIRQLLERQDGR